MSTTPILLTCPKRNTPFWPQTQVRNGGRHAVGSVGHPWRLMSCLRRSSNARTDIRTQRGHEGVRSQCPVAMAPVAHARARVVVDHRQVRLMIGGSACCTIVLTLRWRAAHLNTSTWANGNATRQSALWRRVGCGTRHRSPRGVLCVWSSTSSSSCGFWLFPGTWVGLAAARPSIIFQGFCVLCASKPEKFSGLAGADGHRTES